MRILVFGATGFLGRHLCPKLSAHGFDVATPSRIESNAESLQDCRDVIDRYQPQTIVNLAAYSGGIGANQKYPADFYFKNTIMTANVFEASVRSKVVERLYYPIGGCSYPARAVNPISEDCLWTGFPQEESAAYSLSKLLGSVAASAYEKQHGLKTQVLIPGNMYGEHDNYELMSSHVVAAFVRKFIEAKQAGKGEVQAWGTGKAIRDFVYAGDVADIIVQQIVSKRCYPIMNVSSGVPTSIKELAGLVAKLVGYEGKISWDHTRSDGQLEKLFSIDRLTEFGFSCPTSLEDGLIRTINWYKSSPSHLRR
jgi:GDP-L-fucose synthase